MATQNVDRSPGQQKRERSTSTPISSPPASSPKDPLFKLQSTSSTSANFLANISGTPAIQGYLFTAFEDDEVRNFRKRLLKLQGNLLLAYFQRYDGEHQFDRMIELNEYCSVHDVQEKLRRECCWLIHVPPIGRKYYFIARNIQQARDWFAALNREIRNLKNARSRTGVLGSIASLPAALRDSLPPMAFPRSSAMSVSMPSLPSAFSGNTGVSPPVSTYPSTSPSEKMLASSTSQLPSHMPFQSPPISSPPSNSSNREEPPVPPKRSSISGFSAKDIKAIDVKWEKLMSQHPGDEKVIIFDNLTMILGMRQHPLGSLMGDFLDGMQVTLVSYLQYDTIEDTSLQIIVQKLQAFRKQILSSVLTYYDFLPIEFENHCLLAIDDIMFSGLYPDLFALFRKVNKEEDRNYMDKLEEAQHVTMKQLGVKPMLWLHEKGEKSSSSYSRAVNTFRKLPSVTPPQQKLMCLIETGRAIRQCTDEYWQKRLSPDDPKRVVLGGDDLLPLYTWTIIQAQVPFLYTESEYIDYFITNTESIGEEGYYFATFQTAIAIISALHQQILHDDEDAKIFNSPKEAKSAPVSPSPSSPSTDNVTVVEQQQQDSEPTESQATEQPQEQDEGGESSAATSEFVVLS
eukprot:TRINITY_DN7042_c0_g1_i1.p1 TRINITY_DN7042_c0_g1~~TRINITY_DN7042_c0_g1_i1.p1  ORF type:complete len:629 (-),score=130.07 TRINITY_DN7042_c0_g1_i1:144-2030(-)